MAEFIEQLIGWDLPGFLAYITNGKHLSWYASLRWTIGAALLGGLFALLFGMVGALAKRSHFWPLRTLGLTYISMVRGIPDVLFLIFFPLAFEIGVEQVTAQFVCTAAELNSPQWPPCPGAAWNLSSIEHFLLACLSFGIVFGAFTAHVLDGGLSAVPKGQLEAAHAYGYTKTQTFWHVHMPQMWVYALPGLSNIWLLLLKSTSLLSLLQIADIVQWAGRLGAPNFFASAGLVHGDWRAQYYFVLFVLYILMTVVSEKFFASLTRRASRGMATEGGRHVR